MVFALAVDAPQRKLSIGSEVRCAAAFACEELFVIGESSVNTFGCHGSNKYLRLTHFFYWEDFWAHMRAVHADCKVYGIVESAGPCGEGPAQRSSEALETLAFHASALFVLSRPFVGHILEHCDHIIHVAAFCPQYSLAIKYDAKVAMCLHYFTSSQGYRQAAVCGEKFVVSGKLRGAKKVRSQRAAKADAGVQPAEEGEEHFFSSMFSSGEML